MLSEKKKPTKDDVLHNSTYINDIYRNEEQTSGCWGYGGEGVRGV